MPISKTKASKTGRGGSGRNTNATPTKTWDTQSKPDEYDGRANLQAGDKGKEPGGRWRPGYYESGPKVIGKIVVRNPGS